MNLLTNVIEFIIFTVIVKGIIAHYLADLIVKVSKKWLNAQPHRMEHYQQLLHKYRSEAGTL
jgi:hypothetical protein